VVAVDGQLAPDLNPESKKNQRLDFGGVKEQAFDLGGGHEGRVTVKGGMTGRVTCRLFVDGNEVAAQGGTAVRDAGFQQAGVLGVVLGGAVARIFSEGAMDGSHIFWMALCAAVGGALFAVVIRVFNSPQAKD
jgi:hypothetical protein